MDENRFSPRHILFVELLGGLGDVLIALPAIAALGRTYPQAQLTVLTFAPGSDLLRHHPLIHRVVPARFKQARAALDELLAKQPFDLIVSDTNYDGIADAIHRSGATRAVTNLWRNPPVDERVGDRFLKILLDEGVILPDAIGTDEPLIHLTPEERSQAHEQIGAAFRPLVVLCPDAGMPIKRWPLENFVEVGRALQQQGATICVPVGSDLQQAHQLVEAIGGTARLWSRGPLRHLAAMMAEADLVIAADTGPARIAAALNIPTITLFGPSWAGRYGQPAPHANLQGYPGCPERNIANFTEQSCWYSGVCPFDQWNTCLEAISPQDVLEAANPLLNQQNLSHTPPLPLSPVSSSLSSPWRDLQRILVLRMDNIGDVIMTSPVLRAIKENLPQSHLTLMASPGGALTAPLFPWVDDVLPWRSLWQDLGRLDFDPEREWDLVRTLRDRHFDAAVILTSFSQSPHPPALLCQLAGIPLRLGESKETDLGTLTHAIPPAPDEIHQVERNLRLIESVGFQVRDRRLSLHVAQPQSVLNRPYILLNPWTSCQSRNYDPGRFAIAARHLSHQTGWPVVVTGVAKDRDHSTPLLETLGDRAIDLIGKTTLDELVALIADAELVLTNNTSTMHIADAMHTPSVVLFAGTELEGQWRPRHSPHRLLRRPTVCSPCYAFTCPHELQCLDIAPETVVAAGLELLQEIASTEVTLRGNRRDQLQNHPLKLAQLESSPRSRENQSRP